MLPSRDSAIYGAAVRRNLSLQISKLHLYVETVPAYAATIRPAEQLNSLSLTIVQPDEGKHLLDFQVANIGAGHSVPTGEPSRAVFLRVEVLDKKGACRARKEWMFAPSYSNRPDDKAFLEEDKKRPDGAAASRADAQGPHESSIRAGEERVLPWEPVLAAGEYTVKARLLYSLDRYHDKPAKEDESEITNATLAITAK